MEAGNYNQDVNVKKNDDEIDMSKIPKEFMIFLSDKQNDGLNLDKEMSESDIDKVADEFKIFLQDNPNVGQAPKKVRRIMSEDEVVKFNEQHIPDKFKSLMEGLEAEAPEVKSVKRKLSREEFLKYQEENIPDEIADIFMKMKDDDNIPEVRRESRKMSEDEVYNYNQKQISKMDKDHLPDQFAELLKAGEDTPVVKNKKRMLSEDEILKFNKEQFHKWHGKDAHKKLSPQKLEMEFEKWEWHMRKFQRQQQIRAEKLKKFRNKNWMRVEAALRKQRNKHSAWLKHLLERANQEIHKKMKTYTHRRTPEEHIRKRNKYFHHIGL